MDRRGLWLNVAVKVVLVGLLLFSVFSDLQRVNGKAMTARALTYPVAALVVPVVWWLRGRPRPFTLALRRTQLGLLLSWSLAVGFGAVTEILWELGEYLVMKLGSSGLQLTYTDTIGDLAFGGSGTLLGASLVSVAWRLSRT